MPSLSDLKRAWLLRQLGLSSSSLTEADLMNQLYSNSNTTRLEGTGFPEGVVSAPVGSTYTDRAATNGATLWVKQSGTGNTGWRVVSGDTGWRTVNNLVNTTEWNTVAQGAGSSRRCLLRRVNERVYLKFILDKVAATGTAASSLVVLNLPTGFINTDFTPIGSGIVQSAIPATVHTSANIGEVRINAGGNTSAWAAGQNSAAEVNFITDNAWPTVLP